MMNEAYQAHDGLPPDLFPPDIPTYTGHYHKPHTVPGTRITYIGSPYQGACLPACRWLPAFSLAYLHTVDVKPRGGALLRPAPACGPSERSLPSGGGAAEAAAAVGPQRWVGGG